MAIDPVDPALLDDLAGTWTDPKQSSTPPPASPKAPFGQPSFIDDWIAKFVPDAGEPEPWKGGRIWSGIPCLFRPSDGRTMYIIEHQDGGYQAACHHNTCPGTNSTRRNHWNDLRDLVEPGWRQQHQQADPPPTCDATQDPLIKQDLSLWGLRPAPRINHLIQDILASGEACMIAGPPNVGKGLLCIEIGGSVALGMGLFGRVGSGISMGVILVQLEDAAEEMERRLARWLEARRKEPGWSTDMEGQLRRNLVILTPNWNSKMAKTLPALAPFILREAEELRVRGIRVGLIVIDTLTAVSEGDENSVEAQRAIWPAAYNLRDETGAAVMLVHHVRKTLSGSRAPHILERVSPDSIRGSSANNAAARSILQMEPLRPSEATMLNIDSEKARRGGFVILAQTKVVSGPKGSWVLLDQQSDGFWAPHPESDRLCAELQGARAVEDLTQDEALLLSIADGCRNRKELREKHWPNMLPDRQAELLKSALNRLRNRHHWVQSGRSFDLAPAGTEKVGLLRPDGAQPGNQEEPPAEPPGYWADMTEGL